jgi:DNA replication protein
MNCHEDKKGNVTAAFGTDLVSLGATSVPNLILKYYHKIGITDNEMMLITQLIRLRGEQQPFPSLEAITECMAADSQKIKSDLAALIEKGVLAVGYYFDDPAGEVLSVYSIEPLMEKVSEVWACDKVKELQKMRQALKEQGVKISPKKAAGQIEGQFTNLCQSFEKEFGRPLSPMEIEQVGIWLTEHQGKAEFVLEALKRAVMRGKHNFKYIDSILLEWKKNNLRTVGAIMEYEENFRQRQVKRGAGYKGDTGQKNKGKGKDKFKLLYMS